VSNVEHHAVSHDAVVAHVARTRFPFAGQTTWPGDYQTITNVPEPRRGIDGPGGLYYPDIVIIDGAGRSREIGEVEVQPDPARIALWRAAEAAADRDTPTGVKHLFFYVPAGTEQAMVDLLDAAGISYAGVRGFAALPDGAGIDIRPFLTPGDPYDHQ
jgi:hypothetical protein